MQNSDTYDTSLLCECLEVSRSGFYKFFFGKPSNRTLKKQLICNLLLKYHEKDKKLGSPRLTLILREEGIKIAQSTVSNYMRQLGICSSVSPKKFKSKSSKLTLENAPYIVNKIKGLVISSLNQVWTTDITYIRTKVGWAYLSSIIDQCSKKVIAFRMDYYQTASMCLETVYDALKTRKYSASVILHSDKGSQYRSKIYRKALSKNRIIQSFTSLGHSCDENAAQESFHATLKKECIQGFVFEDLEQAQRVIFRWIEGYYNSHRPHTKLGGLTPNDFELKIKEAESVAIPC